MSQKVLDLKALVSGDFHAQGRLRLRGECSLGTADKSIDFYGCRRICRKSARIGYLNGHVLHEASAGKCFLHAADNRDGSGDLLAGVLQYHCRLITHVDLRRLAGEERDCDLHDGIIIEIRDLRSVVYLIALFDVESPDISGCCGAVCISGDPRCLLGVIGLCRLGTFLRALETCLCGAQVRVHGGCVDPVEDLTFFYNIAFLKVRLDDLSFHQGCHLVGVFR